MKPLGCLIRAEREKRDMSLSDLARASGVSRQYLYLIEASQNNPTLSKVAAIAKAFGMTLIELLSEQPEPITGHERALIDAYRAGDIRKAMGLILKRLEDGDRHG